MGLQKKPEQKSTATLNSPRKRDESENLLPLDNLLNTRSTSSLPRRIRSEGITFLAANNILDEVRSTHPSIHLCRAEEQQYGTCCTPDSSLVVTPVSITICYMYPSEAIRVVWGVVREIDRTSIDGKDTYCFNPFPSQSRSTFPASRPCRVADDDGMPLRRPSMQNQWATALLKCTSGTTSGAAPRARMDGCVSRWCVEVVRRSSCHPGGEGLSTSKVSASEHIIIKLAEFGGSRCLRNHRIYHRDGLSHVCGAAHYIDCLGFFVTQAFQADCFVERAVNDEDWNYFSERGSIIVGMKTSADVGKVSKCD